LHGDYNKTLVVIKLVDIVNTIMIQTLLDYAPENLTHLGYGSGCTCAVDLEKLSSVNWTFGTP